MTDLAKYGPWAVIAGGSEGVGAEFADQLAADGFNLLLVARKPGPLEDTAEAVRKAHGVEVRTVSADLTDPAAIKQITDTTADVEVGLLIYNAGANSYGGAFLKGELEGFQGVIDLNVTAMLALTHHYGRAMKERGRGGIILIGSLAGYVGTTSESIYGGVKAFSRIFAEGLWAEMREYGVDVLEFVLGLTRTPAMVRAGLNFDVPGVAVTEPVDAAREALAAIADGPVQVISTGAKVVEMRSNPDRARLVLGTEKVMKMMVPKHA